jgi:hypothetical protein
MAGLKPELFDYNAAVDKADAEGYDWEGLRLAINDPGFESLSDAHQKHLLHLYTVKSERVQGRSADPNAATGELGGLRQLGTILKALFTPAVGLGMPGKQAALGQAADVQKQAIAQYVAKGQSEATARQLKEADLRNTGQLIMQQYAHNLTGGVVAAPEETKDVFAKRFVDGAIKPLAGFAAMGTHLATGSIALSWLSKLPMVNSVVANMSMAKRGLIKGAILDFGMRAAIPEGLPKDEEFGIADDVARALTPDNVQEDSSSLINRFMYGVGGAVEGGLFNYALRGIGFGVKLADAKYGITIKKEQLVKALEAAGVDVTGMSKQDMWMTYRTRMNDHVQGMDEAVFNGERLSAESWIAQAFLADPNITELTAAEGRILWGVFSNNKGGISIIKGIDNPEQALEKLRKVGINVDATVIPRRKPGDGGATGRPRPVKPPKKPKSPKDGAINAQSPENLMSQARKLGNEYGKREAAGETGDAMRDLANRRDEAYARANFAKSDRARVEELASLKRKRDELVGAYGPDDPDVKRLDSLIREGSKPGETVMGLTGKTADEVEQMLHPSKGLPEGVSTPQQRESIESITSDVDDIVVGDNILDINRKLEKSYPGFSQLSREEQARIRLEAIKAAGLPIPKVEPPPAKPPTTAEVKRTAEEGQKRRPDEVPEKPKKTPPQKFSDQIIQRVRDVFNGMDPESRLGMFGRGFMGRPWDQLTSLEQQNMLTRYVNGLNHPWTYEEIVMQEDLIRHGLKNGHLTRDAFTAMMRDLSEKRKLLRKRGNK